MQLWTDGNSSKLGSVRSDSKVVVVTLGFVFALYIAWTGAWMAMPLLEEHVGWPATSDARSLYWTVLKGLFWVLPAILVFRYSRMSVNDAFRGRGIRSILLWGVGVGALIGAEVVIRKWISHQPYSLAFSWPLLNVIVTAPFVEEFVFRGAVLGGLLMRYRFGVANVIASLLFVGAHFPGWYFTGSLIENLTKPVGGALSIFILGLIFGFVTLKCRSVAGGMIAHAINNLFSVI